MKKDQLLALTLVVVGAILLSYGAWLLLAPVGYIVGGFACLGIQHWLSGDEERGDR